jgi:hypothetical protein
MEIQVMFQASSPLFIMMLHSLIMFVYDQTIIKEIREHQELESTLNKFRWFNRVITFSPMKVILSFKFWGITHSLNVIGSVAAVTTYLVFSYYFVFIGYVLLYEL